IEILAASDQLYADYPQFGSVGQRVGFKHQNSLVHIVKSEYLRNENSIYGLLSKHSGTKIVSKKRHLARK
ncbi:MAG: hypothetical protein WBK14_05640, partial [Bacteroidales bacterium]